MNLLTRRLLTIPLVKNSALLSIGTFTGETPKLVAEHLRKVNSAGIKNLVIDVCGNVGGPFDPAVKTAELFIARIILVQEGGVENSPELFEDS